VRLPGAEGVAVDEIEALAVEARSEVEINRVIVSHDAQLLVDEGLQVVTQWVVAEHAIVRVHYARHAGLSHVPQRPHSRAGHGVKNSQRRRWVALCRSCCALITEHCQCEHAEVADDA
jgi:hypothetical protein